MFDINPETEIWPNRWPLYETTTSNDLLQLKAVAKHARIHLWRWGSLPCSNNKWHAYRRSSFQKHSCTTFVSAGNDRSLRSNCERCVWQSKFPTCCTTRSLTSLPGVTLAGNVWRFPETSNAKCARSLSHPISTFTHLSTECDKETMAFNLRCWEWNYYNQITVHDYPTCTSVGWHGCAPCTCKQFQICWLIFHMPRLFPPCLAVDFNFCRA